MAKVTKASCARKGKKFVHIKGKASFCAGKGGKKRRSGKKAGITKMSKAARKTMMKKVCSKLSASKKKKMAGLCRWARS